MHILYSVQARTHPGRVRKNNEDAYGTVLDWRQKLHLSDEVLQQRGHLFAVADGMGGHAAGEIASQLAIETLFTQYYLGEWKSPKATLAAAIAAANQVIFERAQADPRLDGMGTTLVAALYQPEYGLVANVGDSRAYLYRSGKMIQVTRDHSWVAEQLENGVISAEEAAHHPFRNVITRALGNEAQVEPEFFELPPLPHDVLLLCSDGLSNQVSDQEMAEILGAYPLDEAADMLVNRTLERGAPDNVTLVLVQLLGGAVQRRSRSFLPWLALMVALVAIAGFVFWNFGPRFTGPVATESPEAVPLGTFTPVPSPTPMRTPGSASTPLPTLAASPTPVWPQAAGDFSSPAALIYAPTQAAEQEPLVFVSGQVEMQDVSENEDLVGITVANAAGKFSTDLDVERFVDGQPHKWSGRFALVGYLLAPADNEKDYSLKPLLLLTPFKDKDSSFVIKWERDDKALPIFADSFQISVEQPVDARTDVIKLTP